MSHETELPNAPETESVFLGSILLDPQLMDEAAHEPPDIFYGYANRLIFTAMLEQHRQHAEINPVTIANALGRDAQKVGGVPGISKLSDKLPAVTKLAPYTKILRQKLTARQGFKEAARLQAAFLDESEDPQVTLATATERFASMREASTNGFKGGRLIDLVPQVEDHLYLLRAGINPAVATGCEPLDRLTGGGPTRSEMWGIAARSSEGKSSILLQTLKYMASHDAPSILFSLEMKALLIALRALAAESGVPMNRIRYGISEIAVADLLAQVRKSLDFPIWIYNDCKSVHEIKNRIGVVKRELANQGKELKVVGIDYFGKVSGYGRGRDKYENKTQELKYTADFIQQDISIGEDLVTIVAAQFNRSAWGKKDPGPESIDGGEAYYQACDLFAVLTTEAQKDEGDLSKARLAVWKQRNGPTAVGKRAIKLQFHRPKMQFYPTLDELGEEVPDDKENQFL